MARNDVGSFMGRIVPSGKWGVKDDGLADLRFRHWGSVRGLERAWRRCQSGNVENFSGYGPVACGERVDGVVGVEAAQAYIFQGMESRSARGKSATTWTRG